MNQPGWGIKFYTLLKIVFEHPSSCLSICLFISTSFQYWRGKGGGLIQMKELSELPCMQNERKNAPHVSYYEKTDFYLCRSKGADQMCSNCTSDQRLYFPYRDSTIPLLLKSETLSDWFL